MCELIDVEATSKAFKELTGTINKYYAEKYARKVAYAKELAEQEAKQNGRRNNKKKPNNSKESGDSPAAQAAAMLAGGPIVMTPEQVAFGFLEVANESMCRPIRAMTQAKGYSLSDHVLACFGGAGGQHACALARSLGIQTIY